MRIHLVSDLHFEHKTHTVIPAPEYADVIVVAGDLHYMPIALDICAQTAAQHGKPVIFVPGNHEYYRGNIYELKDVARNYTAENVHVLDDRSVVIDDVHFIGSTLWTDFSGPALQAEIARATEIAQKTIADFSQISVTPGDLLCAKEMALLHACSALFIKKELRKKLAKRQVVITHFAPNISFRNDFFPLDPLAHYFCANRSDLLKDGADLWLYGHTHMSMTKRFVRTMVHSNQIGYPGETGTGYDPDLLIEV